MIAAEELPEQVQVTSYPGKQVPLVYFDYPHLVKESGKASR